MPRAKAEPVVPPETTEGAIFDINKDDLRTMARLLIMVGKLTDSREEKRTTGALFTEFGGFVSKNPPKVLHDSENNETTVESGTFDVIMSNKSKNAYGNLSFKIGTVHKEGQIHCGDSVGFARIASKVDMGETVKVSFSSEEIIFTDDLGVDISIRNDESSTLEYVENAKTMKAKVNLSSEPCSYDGKELVTLINMDLKELIPVVKDSDILGLMSYPIEVKKDDAGEFYIKAKAFSKDKVTINRKITDVDVIGEECESAYAVGLDSVVSNLSGKVLIHIGDWKPMFIISENEKYKYVIVLANIKQGQENEIVFNVNENIFDDGSSEEDEETEEEDDYVAEDEDGFM